MKPDGEVCNWMVLLGAKKPNPDQDWEDSWEGHPVYRPRTLLRMSLRVVTKGMQGKQTLTQTSGLLSVRKRDTPPVRKASVAPLSQHLLKRTNFIF